MADDNPPPAGLLAYLPWIMAGSELARPIVPPIGPSPSALPPLWSGPGIGTRTRDSTAKHEVVHVGSGTVAITNLSRTDALKAARSMSGDRLGSFMVRLVKK